MCMHTHTHTHTHTLTRLTHTGTKGLRGEGECVYVGASFAKINKNMRCSIPTHSYSLCSHIFLFCHTYCVTSPTQHTKNTHTHRGSLWLGWRHQMLVFMIYACVSSHLGSSTQYDTSHLHTHKSSDTWESALVCQCDINVCVCVCVCAHAQWSSSSSWSGPIDLLERRIGQFLIIHLNGGAAQVEAI